MRLQQFEALIAIAETGGLRAASRRLGKTQPALTKAIRQLEEELHAPLLHRSTRGVSLTPFGLALLSRARAIVNEVSRAEQEIAQLRGSLQGVLGLGLSPAAGVLLAPRALARFRAAMPDVAVRIIDGVYPGALQPLREGAIDLLFGPEPPRAIAADLRFEHLLTTDLAVLARKQHPLAGARSLRELTEADWIVYGAPDGPGLLAPAFFDNRMKPPRAVVRVESLLATMAILEETDVLCVLPDLLMNYYAKRAGLVRVPVRERLTPLRLGLIVRASAPLTPAAQRMADLLRLQATAFSRAG